METTIQKRVITAEAALAAVQAVIEKAKADGWPKAVAVLDDGGNLKAFCRMEGSPLFAIEVAQQKAYTALQGKLSSYRFYTFNRDQFRDDPGLLMAAQAIPGVTLFPGGVPVRINGENVGAIGVSGGPLDHDHSCAQAAAAAIGGDPEEIVAPFDNSRWRSFSRGGNVPDET
jgi:uncharacterized protein GlcG (DUF336 family)